MQPSNVFLFQGVKSLGFLARHTRITLSYFLIISLSIDPVSLTGYVWLVQICSLVNPSLERIAQRGYRWKAKTAWSCKASPGLLCFVGNILWTPETIHCSAIFVPPVVYRFVASNEHSVTARKLKFDTWVSIFD